MSSIGPANLAEILGNSLVLQGASVKQGALTDGSGTITTGGTSQVAFVANAARRYLLVQNPSAATESLWVNFTLAAVASQPSIELTPGLAFERAAGFVPTESVNVVAVTTGHAFTAKEG